VTHRIEKPIVEYADCRQKPLKSNIQVLYKMHTARQLFKILFAIILVQFHQTPTYRQNASKSNGLFSFTNKNFL